jgi:4-amino-4-deoxy-L-arabinose transferase-like glycosyltransferase
MSEAHAELNRRKVGILALGIVLLAGNVVWILSLEPRAYWPDESWYLGYARALATAEPFSDPARRAPGAAFFLAPFVRIVDSWFIWRTSNLLLGALACLASYAVALRSFNSRGVAALAALLCGGYPFFVYQRGFLLSENLTVTLLLAFTWAVLRSRESRSPAGWAWAGLLAGVTNLARPVLLLMPLFVLPLCRAPGEVRWRPALSRAAAFLVTFSLVLTVWVVRNQRLTGSWTLSPFGASEVYKGLVTPPGESVTSHPAPPLAEAGRETVRFLVEHPGRAVLHKLYYLGRFWWPGPDHETQAGGRLLSLASFAVLIPLYAFALVGLRTARPGPRLVLLIVLLEYWVFHVLVAVKFRYRIPLDALLIVFAAGGIRTLAKLWSPAEAKS